MLQAARVNSGSLYHFFPGKQDLLLAVLDMYHGGLRTMLLEPSWRGVTDPIERIFALLARYRRSLADTDCTVARSAASPWNCTNRISRCASGSPRTSPPGPMRSTSA